MKGEADLDLDELRECGGVRLLLLDPPPISPRRGLKGGDSAANLVVVENGPTAAMTMGNREAELRSRLLSKI